MAAKESATTQPGDFHDRYERLLAEARAALRRSGEASLWLPPAELTEEQRGSEGARHSKNNNEKDRFERALAEARKEADSVPVVSRAPKPPSPIRGSSGIPDRSKPTQMPMGWPRYYPNDLIPLTTVIIGEALKKFSVQTQTLQLCKFVISRLTPHLCAAVQDEALSVMDKLLHYLLVANCDDDNQRFRLHRETIKSDEWLKLAKKIARVHLAAAKDSSSIKEPLGLAPAQPPPTTVANGGGRERGAATKKSRRGNDRRGDPTLLDSKDRVTFRTAEQYLGVTERQRQHLVKSGVLSVEGQGNNRKITTESLRKYLPPENPK